MGFIADEIRLPQHRRSTTAGDADPNNEPNKTEYQSAKIRIFWRADKAGEWFVIIPPQYGHAIEVFRSSDAALERRDDLEAGRASSAETLRDRAMRLDL